MKHKKRVCRNVKFTSSESAYPFFHSYETTYLLFILLAYISGNIDYMD